MGQTLRMARGVKTKEATGTEITVVATDAIGGVDFDQLVVFRLDRDLAAVPAEGTDSVGALEHPGPIFVHGQSAGDGADRADLDTASAELAIERVRAEMLDLRHRAAAGRSQGLHVHDFIAVRS